MLFIIVVLPVPGPPVIISIPSVKAPIIASFWESAKLMPKNKVIEETKELLLVKEELIEGNIYNAFLEKKLIVQKINDIECVFIPIFYYSELGITERIARLSIQNYQTINTDIEFEISLFEKKSGINFAILSVIPNSL